MPAVDAPAATHVMLHQVRRKLVKGWEGGSLDGMTDNNSMYREQENMYTEADDLIDQDYDGDASMKGSSYTPTGPPLHSPESSSAENSPHVRRPEAFQTSGNPASQEALGEGGDRGPQEGTPGMNVIAQMSGQGKMPSAALLKVLSQPAPQTANGPPPKAPSLLHRRSASLVPSVGPAGGGGPASPGMDHLSLSNVVKDKYVQRLESKIVELQQRLNESTSTHGSGEEGVRAALQQLRHDLQNKIERVKTLEKENAEIKEHRKSQSWAGPGSEASPDSPAASDLSLDDDPTRNSGPKMDVDSPVDASGRPRSQFWDSGKLSGLLVEGEDSPLASALEVERQRSANLEAELANLKRQQRRSDGRAGDAGEEGDHQLLKAAKEEIARLQETLAVKEKEIRTTRERSQALAESMKRLAAESDQKTSAIREKLNRAVRMGKEVVLQRDQLRADVSKLVTEYEKLEANRKLEEGARQQAELARHQAENERKMAEDRVDSLVEEIAALMATDMDEKTKQLMSQLHKAQQKSELFEMKLAEVRERAELLEVNLEGAEERSEWLAAEGEAARAKAEKLAQRVKAAEVETSRAMVESERANRRAAELEKQLVEIEKQLQREEEKAEMAEGKAQSFQVKLGLANQTKADLATRLEDAEGRADLAEDRAGSLLGIANQRSAQLAVQLQQATDRAKAAEARAEGAEKRANHLHEQLVIANQRQVELANRLRSIESRGGAAARSSASDASGSDYSPHSYDSRAGTGRTSNDGSTPPSEQQQRTGFFQRGSSMLGNVRHGCSDGGRRGGGGDRDHDLDQPDEQRGPNPLKRLIGKGPEIKESLKQGVKNFWAEIKGEFPNQRGGDGGGVYGGRRDSGEHHYRMDGYGGRRDSGEHHMRRDSGDNHRRESTENM